MIETERLLLRHWCGQDAEALYKYASDARVSEMALWPRHTSVEMSRQVIADYFMPARDVFAIVHKESGEAIGCIGLVPAGDEHFGPQPGEREVGYWIGHPYWGAGMTTEAMRALIVFCRDTLRLDSLLITTDTRNIASQRVAEKCGFSFICDYVGDSTGGKAYRLSLSADKPV